MDATTRENLQEEGVQVLTTTHFFAGADRRFATSLAEFIRRK